MELLRIGRYLDELEELELSWLIREHIDTYLSNVYLDIRRSLISWDDKIVGDL